MNISEFDARYWKPVRTEVSFRCSDRELQALYDRAEATCRNNLVTFNGRVFLKEGGNYGNLWPETQPMGGAMYAVRNTEAALDNILVFMQYQRRDGRIPGMLFNTPNRGLCAAYDWFQGFCFPQPALQMYYYLGENRDYLELLYNVLKDYDGYLWKYRDSNHNGCLERWCCWDTGEDHLSVLEEQGGDERCAGGEIPPEAHGCGMPWDSMEFMADSYSARHTLSEISRILDNGMADMWHEKALDVQKKTVEYLWDEKEGACFDHYRDGRRIDSLSQTNLRCMYFGLFTKEMADAFVRRHLMNPEEFFTDYPIPSIAVNNRWFRNVTENNWSGQSQGLTMQRAISALPSYGYDAELREIGKRWLKAVGASEEFYQQYNPFTGEHCSGAPGYGPTALSVLELISVMYGIHVRMDKLEFCAMDDGVRFEYEQLIGDKKYQLKADSGSMTAYLDGRKLYESGRGVKTVTDFAGNITEQTSI